MTKRFKNRKGSTLAISYFILLVLAGLSAALFLRTIYENNFVKRNEDTIQALYQAESGISFALAELYESDNFNWYTHIDIDTPDPNARTQGFCRVKAGNPPTEVGSIDPNGSYVVAGWNFEAKTYPEWDDSQSPPVPSGNVVILSRGRYNSATRIIEFRVGQQSAYLNFFFFPRSHKFARGTYNGHNYGGIHVNGNIYFQYDQNFYYLTYLKSGWKTDELGYIYRPWNGYDALTDTGNLTYNNSASVPGGLPYWMLGNNNQHFSNGITSFRYGEEDGHAESDDVVLNKYLTGADAVWYFNKYKQMVFGRDWELTPDITAGLPEGHHLIPSHHWEITNTNRRNVVSYELCNEWNRGSGSWVNPDRALLDLNQTITIPGYPSANEKTVFQALDDAGIPDSDPRWNQFWEAWETNHQFDYTTGSAIKSGAGWERRFYIAAYDWYVDSDTGMPRSSYNDIGINKEWWEDLTYGDDAEVAGEQAKYPAQVPNNITGEEENEYYLNSKEQGFSAWKNWLANNHLNELGENKSRVQDATQGGKYLNPGEIIGQKYAGASSALKEKAMEKGIYVGLKDGTFYIDAKISGKNIVGETSFFNAAYPGGYYTGSNDQYKPSRVLVLDIKALKDEIDTGGISDFNGIIYVDVEGYNWQGASAADPNADGIMLVNGEVLPSGGLSIISPNNVFIKGNYNLDPVGADAAPNDKNRPKDDPNVINYVVWQDPQGKTTLREHQERFSGQKYTLSESDLVWKPAEVITKRAVYTLSEDFPEPKYMPLAQQQGMQGREETAHLSESYNRQECVNGEDFPIDNWAPRVNEIRSRNEIVNDWLNWAPGHGYSIPDDNGRFDDNWVAANWPEDQKFKLGEDYYVNGRQLRNAVSSDILYNGYNPTYEFEVVHGADGKQNPNSPSKANKVAKNHIYNTAVVTPYAPESYALERWVEHQDIYDEDNDGNTTEMIDTRRVVNGAFIQLPGPFKPGIEVSEADANYAEQVPWQPGYASFYRANDPVKTYNYECRFGRGATSSSRPPSNLTFGQDVSWREVSFF